MLHLILADSELETIPKKIASKKKIGKRAKKKNREPTELVLDSNYDHEAMKEIPDAKRRGRPDIIHVCILSALDTPLNKEGLLRFYVHTRQNKVIRINPETRIPRSYNRFIGLIEQLFSIKEVPPDNPLLSLSDESLEKLINEINPEKTITFKIDGQKIEREILFNNLKKNDDVCVIIGGFPHGDFLSEVEKISDEIITIYKDALEALTVVNHVIHFYEDP
ncbi:MAG: 16S rRNA methyltransferase, partial [Hadesarchaea archaeon]|nr:16S rRNA methyltransferase [Hadesarchaea archaeon]